MPEIVNAEQSQAWNGPEGVHWAAHQDRWNAVNDGFNEPLLDAARITGTDHVLDIGCGTGRTTRLAALRASRGHALGLDLSAPMLAEARARATGEGVANASFVQGDAQTHPFGPGAFDAAISRYGVMFFADPVAAFARIGTALRPGGRLAFVCPAEAGRNGWVAAMASLRGVLPLGGFGRAGTPGMFSLAEPDRLRRLLAEAGWSAVGVERVEAYGRWGRDAGDAADFLLATGPGRHLAGQVPAAELARARTVLREHLRDHEAADGTGVRLLSTSWLVTAERP
ncbi:class I SAM-dependent methyltransferase [Streptomyces sp. BBFR102]|uniref:class I SAM-dependent methyltransferase n=1 Tax=Streptomyces sp. BBFR102 TaxID=3448171 RepID=UPI003F53622B